MSGFSFGATAGTSQNTVKPRLTGNDIYTVKFDGCENEQFEGKKDHNTGTIYNTLKLKFSNENGTFEHTVFEPTSKDFERTESDTKVGKIPNPSGVENMMLLFKHLIDTLNPKVAKAIDEGTQNLGAKNFDELRTLVSKILNPAKGVETQIKLVKNNKGEAQFPGFFSGITKDGKAYVRNNFVGPKLAFTSYELTKINNEATAKPTTQASYDKIDTPNTDNLDLNFDIEL